MKKVGRNQHYEKTIQNLNARKSSIFESAQVVSFNPATLTAEVFGLRSRSQKTDVIVLFPSMFLNTGVFSFPVKGSVGLLFVGPDNSSYLLPAQFIEPKRIVQDNRMKIDASPSSLDFTLSLENYEGGEHLFRSLGGAQVVLKNSGEVEMATSKLHQLILNENLGLFHTIVERTQQNIGYSEFYNGTSDFDDKLHHMKGEVYETSPFWETDEIVSKDELDFLLNQEWGMDTVFTPKKPLPQFLYQFANVFGENGEREISDIDNLLLMGKALFMKEDINKASFDISKHGSWNYTLVDEEIVEEGTQRLMYQTSTIQRDRSTERSVTMEEYSYDAENPESLVDPHTTWNTNRLQTHSDQSLSSNLEKSGLIRSASFNQNAESMSHSVVLQGSSVDLSDRNQTEAVVSETVQRSSDSKTSRHIQSVDSHTITVESPSNTTVIEVLSDSVSIRSQGDTNAELLIGNGDIQFVTAIGTHTLSAIIEEINKIGGEL